MWLLCNCDKVIDALAQSPNLNHIGNLWIYLKKRIATENYGSCKNSNIRGVSEYLQMMVIPRTEYKNFFYNKIIFCEEFFNSGIFEL